MVRVSLIRRLMPEADSRGSAGKKNAVGSRRRWAAVLLAAALAIVPEPGANAQSDVDNPGPVASRQQIVPFQPRIRYPDGLCVLFSGARRSKIEPCGCRGRNLGGVDKEATMIQAFRDGTSASLAVDAGGFFLEFMDENLRLQGWYVLQALKELKFDAINVAYPDFRVGIDVLKKLETEIGLPFISANIVDSGTKQPYFNTHKKLNVPMGNKMVTVGIIGVTAPNHAASNPPEQQLPRKAPPLEIPVQPMASAADHPPVQLGLPAGFDPVASPWVLGSNVHEMLEGRGGSSAPQSVAGGESRALQFALDKTTPTLTKGMYEVLDEVEAIEHLAKELRQECDVMILLAYAGPERSRRIAERVPAFDVVVCGDAFQLYEPYFFGPTNNILWVAPEHDGRILGKVEIAFDEDKTIRDKAGDMIPIDQNIPTVAALTKFIDAYKRDTQKLPPPPGQKIAEKVYVGASRCASCHQQETAQWKTHKHSRAMKALIDKQMQFNPDCLRCHTVAYAKPGGFTDLRVTPFLANVQCESCHGPGKEHMEEERKIAAMNEAERATAQRKAKMNMTFDAQFCMQCHDPENDPHFDFALDIQHVIHTSTQPNRTRVTTSPMQMGMSAASASQSGH